MMIYAEVGASLMQVGGDCPEGWTVMSEPRPDSELSTDYTAQADGTWIITDETLKAKASVIEMAWQATEMTAIANQLLAIEEGAEDVLPGTREQWLPYRTSVRLWHKSTDFPDMTKRPQRPS